MRIIALVVALLLVTSSLTAQGIDKHPSLAKYVDSETVLVAWLDIASLDVTEVASFITEASLRSTSAEELKRIVSIKDALVQLEVRRLYWLSDLASLSNGPQRLIVPSGNPTAASLLLRSTLPPDSQFQFEVDGNVVLGGTQEGIATLKEKILEPIPQLLEAIDACKSEHGIAFATPAYVTTSLSEILKSSLGEDNAGVLAKLAESLAGIKWASISASLPPEQLNIEVRTKSVDAAETLRKLAMRLIDKRLGEGAKALPLGSAGASVKFVSRSRVDSMKAIQAFLSLRTGGNLRTGNSMKRVALALLNYVSAYQHFPPQSLADDNGRRLLSWRVLILPFLDENQLFKQFHLDEPWDSPHNLELAKTIPDVFRSATPLKDASGAIRTRIVAPLTKQSAFGRSGKPISYRDVIDGTSNTILFVEAAPERAVVWTKPEDLVVDVNDPVTSILGTSSEMGFWASRMDGSVQFFSKDNTTETVNALLTIDGREVIMPEDIKSAHLR